MGKIYNRPKDEAKRRHLRRESPPAEVILWQRLRNRQLGGYKFRRQFGIERYVADFCCAECRLIIELDGPSHEGDEAAEYDMNRTHYFEALGFVVARFTNQQIYHALPQTLEQLLILCEACQAQVSRREEYSPSNYN